MNYYNEFDPGAAAWLRELIREGLIPDGYVDERSIEDVRPDELVGYTQCHFFAGIGGWPLALQMAGVSPDTPVWTGSCPCQPFSAAGNGKGADDERHLWPAFRWLIQQCRPATVFGEQVASKAGREWFAGVRADLEALAYACGGADLCAAGVGAPHIRQRLFWVGHSGLQRCDGEQIRILKRGQGKARAQAAGHGRCGGLADSQRTVLEGHPRHGDRGHEPGREQAQAAGPVAQGGGDSWAEAVWIPCENGKVRRIKPGIEPLAYGLPTGLARLWLSGLGNAIVPQVAAEFIAASMEIFDPAFDPAEKSKGPLTADPCQNGAPGRSRTSDLLVRSQNDK